MFNLYLSFEIIISQYSVTIQNEISEVDYNTRIDINLDKLDVHIHIVKEIPNEPQIIYETKPIAILFKNKDKYLIDNLSNLINVDADFFEDSFPSVFGKNAEYNFINFFYQLKDSDFPIEKIKNYYYFQIGRWDLELLNGQIIKLPTKETNKAIKQSIELLNKKDFIDYNIIDLRINGKIVVE